MRGHMSTTLPARPPAPLIVRITAAILALIGLCLVGGGAWLLALGRSPYYLCTGLALIVTGVLLFRAHPAALWLYALILFGPLWWALWEVGLDIWPLVPRGGVLVLIGIWLLMPWVTRGLRPAGG